MKLPVRETPAVAAPVRPLHVLLAEDSPDNRALIEIYFEGSPHRLTSASNGRAAADACASTRFDVILMDICMPVMDGLTATRTIRALEREKGATPVPIIALSANATMDNAELSRQAGCDTQLAKPISKVKLFKTIQECVVHFPPAEQGGGESPEHEEIRELVPAYVEARKREVPEMMRLLAAGDFERIGALSHNIKGTGSGYGLPELTRMGAEINEAAKQADGQSIGKQLMELGNYLNQVKLLPGD